MENSEYNLSDTLMSEWLSVNRPKEENKGRTCCSFGPSLGSTPHLSLCITTYMLLWLLSACCIETLTWHYVFERLYSRCIQNVKACVGVSEGDSPTARCSCCLNGVDSEAVGDVSQHLHCLLVRFVVILHEGKMSRSTAPKKWTN